MVQQAAFDQQEIQTVIERVRLKLRGHAEAVPAEAVQTSGDGIYPTIDAAVAAGRKAFEGYRAMGLKKRHRIIDSVRSAMRARARELADMAAVVTGLGRADYK
jgi:hypothetical protein